MFNAVHDEYLQGSTGFKSEKDYPPWEYPTFSHDAYTHHEMAVVNEAPNPWLLPYFDNLDYMYAPRLPTSVSSFPPTHFEVSKAMGLPTWSDRSPAFLFGGQNDPTEALYVGDEADQNIWDLLVDDTAYQASTPELDVSSFSSASTPSASATRLGTPVFAEDPNVWNAVVGTYPQTLAFQEPALDYGLPPNLQQPCAAPILPDPIYLEQDPLEFSTTSSLPDSRIPSQNGQSNAGGRRVVARDTRRRTLGPYTKKSRVVKSLPPATTEVQTTASTRIVPQPVEQCSIEPSEAVQQPTSSSGLEDPQPSPAVDPNPVPAAFLLPPRLSAILCTYEGCTSNALFTGRAAWRKHLSKHHHIRGNSTAGGVCRFPGCGKYQADSIMRHVVTRHSGVELGCRQCDATFLREDSLKRHVRCSEGHKYFEGRADVFYFDEVYRV